MDKESQVKHYHISVRDLVEFIYKEGSIDDRFGSADPLVSMQEGQRIHKMIQESNIEGYVPEVVLKYIYDFGNYIYDLQGRADGIAFDKDGRPYLIDEIKGVYNASQIEEPVKVHLAQALIYAFIICSQHSLEGIRVRMTYCDLESRDPSEGINIFEEYYDYEKLKRFFHDTWNEFKKWSDFVFNWELTRNKSILDGQFPFEYRKGQRELVAICYKAVKDQKTIFIQAPTGTGKTISTLYPAVQALGRGLADKVFYLTSKTVTRTVVKETAAAIGERGHRLKTVFITARDRICPMEERKCNPDDCPYANGHFDRVNEAVFSIINNEDMITREAIEEYSKKFMVCPFEYSLDVSLFGDVIAGDVNYVFNPTSYLKRFFAEGVKKPYIFLIDEAHNLVDRGRSMYSISIAKEDILSGRRIMKKYSRRVMNALSSINNDFLSWKKEGMVHVLTDSEFSGFALKVMNAVSAFQAFFQKRIKIKESDEIRNLYFNLRYLNLLSDSYGRNYKAFSECGDEMKFNLLCLDPAELIQERLDKASSVILFSATFLPVRYYMNLLCTDESAVAVKAETIFSPDQLEIIRAGDVTTRYKERTPEMFKRYALYIKKIVESRKGNYIVFFPSYELLNRIRDDFIELDGGKTDVISQESDFSEDDKEAFLASFSEDREKSLAAFSVFGGQFSEGIDLKGERLIGVILAGLPIPSVSLFSRFINDYFEEKTGQGFLYSALYPAMCKVLQAGGRLIRTPEDRGIIALLDSRFSERNIEEVYPDLWQDIKDVNVNSAGEALSDFWNKQ